MKREEILSRQIAQWCDACLLPPAWATMIHLNSISPWYGQRMREAGMKSGTPDWMIVCDGIFFVELKIGREKPRKAQAAVHQQLMAAGARVGVAHSLDKFAALLTGWGIPWAPAAERPYSEMNAPLPW